MTKPAPAADAAPAAALPRISVLINNYNYAAFLPACIDSVLAQDYPAMEVIVVDDGSTDRSREIIAGYGDRIKPVLKKNGGQASSFNAGFEASSGEIICLLDSDDTFLPGKLVQLSRYYEDPELAWCFDRVTTNEADGPPAMPVATPFDRRTEMARGEFRYIPVPTSGLSFRRSLLAKILPMREAKDVVLSDNYIKFAAAYLGRGLLVETPLTFQRLHEANRYTGTDKGKQLKPRIMTATGLELAQRYPGLKPLARHMVAGGIAESDTAISSLPAEIRKTLADSPFQGESLPFFLAWVLLKRARFIAKGRDSR